MVSTLFTGAQDFLPDFLEAPKWYSIYGIYPKYTGLVTAMSKAKAWMMHARVSLQKISSGSKISNHVINIENISFATYIQIRQMD